MTEELDTQLVAALRTLEREPSGDGRDAVARRVRHRRVRGVAGAVAAALVVGVGIGAVIASNDDPPRHVVVGQSGPEGPPLSAAATGVLTYPTTVAPGDDFSAVLRNPLSSPNTACFLAVQLERWDGGAWGAPRELMAAGVDPNLAGPGADCHPDLIQPGAFIGERKFALPGDLPPGDYRIVEPSTEGEGRLTVLGPNQVAASVPPPTSRHSIDLAPGGGLDDTSTIATLDREQRGSDRSPKAAVLLDDSRLAIAWHSACNAPARRIDFDYGPDRVTARVEIGSFLVIDCVGESDRWSTVVDLPAPLWGRELDVVVGSDSERASRVDATPLSTFVLPETEPGGTGPPILPTSILRQTDMRGGRTKPGVNPDAISVSVYGGSCLANAQSAVYVDADKTIYVQPHVQVPDNISGDCGPWQFFDVPAQLPPGSHFFALTGIT